jgi:hypothetical protein
MFAHGPKLRFETVCFSAAVRGKQTLGELLEIDVQDPNTTLRVSRSEASNLLI